MISVNQESPEGPFAHSANSCGKWHDLREHLESVARLAGEEPGPRLDRLVFAMFVHDVGKLDPDFQAMEVEHVNF